MDELISAIRSGQAFGYICENYYKYSKELLKDILLEYIYLAKQFNIDDLSVADNIEMNYNINDTDDEVNDSD